LELKQVFPFSLERISRVVSCRGAGKFSGAYFFA